MFRKFAKCKDDLSLFISSSEQSNYHLQISSEDQKDENHNQLITAKCPLAFAKPFNHPVISETTA